MEDNKFLKLLADAREIVEKAISENRPMTEDERNQSMNMVNEAKQGLDDIAFQKKVDELEAAAVKANSDKAEIKHSSDLGREFTDSADFKDWMHKIAPNGAVSEKARIGQSPYMTVDFPLEKKALITGLSDTSAGAFVPTENSGIYAPLGRPQLTILDLISVRQTGTDAVEYVQQTAQVTQAAPVAEATSLANGLKPEGAMAFAKKLAPVETIAVWVPVTKRALADARQLRGIINQELRESVMSELENQVLNGSGVSPQFAGIANTAGVLTQAFATDALTTARKAITNLRVNGLDDPTAFVLHPQDWEAIELALFAAAPYLPYQKSLWRVPVVENMELTAATGYLGNWSRAVLWDRDQFTISMSDSHSDFFVRNLVAVLGELRAAFGVIRPKSFVKITLTDGQD